MCGKKELPVSDVQVIYGVVLLTAENVVKNLVVNFLGKLCNFLFEGQDGGREFLLRQVTVPTKTWR